MRSLTPAVAACALAACALAACGRGRPQVAPLPGRGPARDSLLAADAGRAAVVGRRGLAAGAAEWVSDDVVYLRAGYPAAYGRAAVRALLDSADDDGAARVWQPLGGGLSRDRRHGYTFGVAAVAPRSSPLRLERYIAFWRRGSGGAWVVAAYAEVAGSGGGSAAPALFAPQAAASARPGSSVAPAGMPVGRSRPLDGPRPPDDRVIASLRAADSAFADLADLEGIAAAFASYAAPQGVVFAGSELVVGPTAVRDQFRAQLESSGGTLSWQPEFAGAADSGDLGFTVGEYVFTGRGPSGAAAQRFGKYLTVWERQPDGSWKFVVDGGNANPRPSRPSGSP